MFIRLKEPDIDIDYGIVGHITTYNNDTFPVRKAQRCNNMCNPSSVYHIVTTNLRDFYISECCDEYIMDCYNCGRHINKELLSPDITLCYKNGSFLCNRCIENELNFCNSPRCLRITSSTYCDNCGNEGIYPYDFDVMEVLKIRGHNKQNLYFGVEYEVKPTDYSIYRLAKLVSKDFKDEAICVHDGSLRDDDGEGLEIVSAPMTFEMQKDFQRRFFEKGYSYESYANDKCSIHVHMSRLAFNPIQLAKFKLFFYAPANRPFIEKIGGRPLQTGWGKRYARLTDNYKITDLVCVDKGSPYDRLNTIRGRAVVDYKELFKEITSKKTLRSTDPDTYRHEDKARYAAVNCTNADTIEVRIFKGCNKLATMYKNIEFCKAVFDFTKSSIVPYSKIYSCVEEFINYTSKYKKIYPNLIRFIERHNLKECVVEEVPEMKVYHENNMATAGDYYMVNTGDAGAFVFDIGTQNLEVD